MIVGYFPSTRGHPELSYEIHRLLMYRPDDSRVYSVRLHPTSALTMWCELTMEFNLFECSLLQHPQYFWKYETV